MFDNKVYLYNNDVLVGYTTSLSIANKICEKCPNYKWDFFPDVSIEILLKISELKV